MSEETKYKDPINGKPRPISIQEFIETLNDHDKETTKKVIDVYQSHRHYLDRRLCAICDKTLTKEEIISMEPNFFNYTCVDHRNYAEIFQTDIIRQKLGIPDRSPFL